MKIITVGTLKGGTGKTTTTFNLAGCLAEEHKVLLIDCDPQANLSQDCGIDITNQTAPSIKSVFDSYLAPEKTVVRSPIAELPNLDVLPSNIWLTETEMMMVNRSGRERILDNYMADNRKFFERYDYIICDTNPSMSVINQNAFFIADSIVLITDISKNGLTGIELFDYLWSKAAKDLRKENNIKAVLLNNSDQRTTLSRELLEYCQYDKDLKELLVLPVIPQAIRIKETSVEHKPINVYEPPQKDVSKEREIFREVVAALKKKGVF